MLARLLEDLFFFFFFTPFGSTPHPMRSYLGSLDFALSLLVFFFPLFLLVLLLVVVVVFILLFLFSLLFLLFFLFFLV